MKKIILLSLLGIAALGLASCQTVEGVGRDISAGGQALTNVAER
ncbi:entericidin A/B family lipoprotein [Rubritalea sp.]